MSIKKYFKKAGSKEFFRGFACENKQIRLGFKTKSNLLNHSPSFGGNIVHSLGENIMMNKKHKVYARVVAAAMTLGMAYSGTTTISALNADGTLANATGHLCAVNNVAAAAATLAPCAIPDKAVLVIHGGALTFTSGGFVQEGGTATIDFDTTANTLLSWYAQKSGDLYIRVASKGTALATQAITHLCFGPNCKNFNVWKCADSTAVTGLSMIKVATPTRDAETLAAEDLPNPAPTKVLGGRTYTLIKQYKSA